LGHTRYTKDIAFWIRRSEENAQRAAGALREFGIPLGPDSISQLAQDRKLLQFGVKPQRVDILTFLDGCEFDTAIERAAMPLVANVPGKFLTLGDYVLTKPASGRRKDLRDIEDLRDVIGPPLPGDPL
jgi:hypothetical protein